MTTRDSVDVLLKQNNPLKCSICPSCEYSGYLTVLLPLGQDIL